MINKVNEKDKILSKLSKYPLFLKLYNLIRPPSLKFGFIGVKNRQEFSELVENSQLTGDILDIGSGPIKNGNTKGLSQIVFSRRKALDYKEQPGVDIVGDVHNLPLADDSLAGVLFQGVIEHIDDPSIALNEIHRVLKPGGFVYVEAPFMQHFHYDPQDNLRFTDDGLAKFFSEKFEVLQKGSLYGPSTVLADVIIEYLSVLFRHPVLYWVAKWFFGWLLFWIKYLDLFFIGNNLNKYLSLGVYIIGRKNT